MRIIKLRPWLEFFRVQNLITVPGDVIVGMSAAGGGIIENWRQVLGAAFASVFLYMFGLADNDIVGAATDHNRPLGLGTISMAAARLARMMVLVAMLLCGKLSGLPPRWWQLSLLLAVLIVFYNRTKSPVEMGLCRGLNVLCGAAVFSASFDWRVLVAAFVWTLYIAAVTKFSERETVDAANPRKVAALVYGLVGLQLVAIIFYNLTR